MDEHQKWFERKIQSLDTTIYIGYYEDCKIGMIRFENGYDGTKVNVMLNPSFIGQGLGSKLIKFGVKKFMDDHVTSKAIIAEIKENNVASIKAFQKAGFKMSHLTYIFDSKGLSCE